MFTILENIIRRNKLLSFNVSLLKDMCRYFEIPYKSRDLKVRWRPFSQGFRTGKGTWTQQKVISFCKFTARELECLVCCPLLYDKLCVVHWLFSECRKYIIVETNYEAFYKMKLQNEWGTFIDLKILPVFFFYDVLPDIWVTLFGRIAEYMEYC